MSASQAPLHRVAAEVIVSLLVPLFLASAAACAPAPVPAAGTLEELYRAGTTFDAFLEAAEARRELWLKNRGRAAVADDIVERARATGPWKLLVIAVDGCSDSVSTIPYIARLTELVPDLELRIVHPDAARDVMEAHRTPDGRAATPTVLLLDASFTERGCWIERPSELQTWWLGSEDLPQEERVERKMEWYDGDLGVSTVREIVEMMEAAAAGRTACAAA